MKLSLSKMYEGRWLSHEGEMASLGHRVYSAFLFFVDKETGENFRWIGFFRVSDSHFDRVIV